MPVDNIQLIACTPCGVNAGFTAEGKVEVINIAQDRAARHASLPRQLTQQAGLLFKEVDYSQLAFTEH